MKIQSRAPSAEYSEGWDRVFGKSAALKAYWDAKTPEAERSAYAHMMAIGIPDAYAAEDQKWIDEGNRQRDALIASARPAIDAGEKAAAQVLNDYFKREHMQQPVVDAPGRPINGLPAEHPARGSIGGKGV